MSDGTNMTIYIAPGIDQAEIRESLAALSQAHGLGRGPGPLLVAIAQGELQLQPTPDSQAMGEIPSDLVSLLEQSAAALSGAGHTALAAELERRTQALSQAWQG